MRWSILFLVVAIGLLGFLFSQDILARLAWQKYGRTDIALWLVRRDADLAMLLGNYYFGQTLGKSEYDVEKAQRAYQKALRAEPGILWGHYQLARLHFMRAEYDRALNEIEKELEVNPENLRSLYVRGLIYGYRGQAGDLEKAEDDFRRFTYWAPKEWAGYNDLAWILEKEGKYGEAEKTVSSALSNVPDADKNPWLWNALGVAQLNLKKYPAAASSFEKAKELAEKLTLEEWRQAYPGNNPDSAREGLLAFKKAIEENLCRARGAVDKCL